MPEKMSRAACFEHFGTVCKNPRWSWSAKSEDGRTVAVTMWRDEFSEQGRVYESRLRTDEKKRPGATERMENLRWAIEHCDGIVHVVVATAKDVHADPREIDECYPGKMLMRIVSLDDETGHFRAERIDRL